MIQITFGSFLAKTATKKKEIIKRNKPKEKKDCGINDKQYIFLRKAKRNLNKLVY